MAYFKVLITEKFVYEILVRANDEADAIKQANTFDGSWGEPIHTSTDTYDVTELEIKNVS
jgi:hypothetical protein